MKKILVFLIFAVVLTSSVLAARYEDNYFRYGEIDSSGNIIESSTSINDVSIIGFVCSSSNCGSVSSNLWGGVLNSGDDFIQLTYPTLLMSAYGYGVYMYKDGYIPYEVSTNWWGTNSNDPVGPYNNFLTKKKVCHPNINSVQTQVSNGNINVNLSVHSPIDNAGPLNYIPPSLTSQYSADLSVRLEVWENNSVYYLQNKSVVIPFSGDKTVSFSFPADSGVYNVQVYTSTDDSRCIDYTPGYENKTIIITCDEDLDCGNSFYSGNFCVDKNVSKNYTSFTCNNPGTTISYCSSSTVRIVNKTCSDYCSNGECGNFKCKSNLECGNSMCLAGDNFCSGLNVYHSAINFTCINPGTINAICSNLTYDLLIGNCDYNCSLGSCFG